MANLRNLKVSKVSYETIKNTANSLTNLTASTYMNGTSTAERAPYLIRIIQDGEWTLDDQAKAAAKLLDCTFEQARYYWSALMELVAEVLTDGVHTSVDFGYWRFEIAVSGSVPSSNAPCTADNEVYIAVYPSAELQAVAASIKTKADVSAQPFIIDCVFGENGERFLTGGKDALVMGRDFSAPTRIELVNNDITAECTYKPVEDDLPTRIRISLPTITYAAKDYALRITAAGQDGTVQQTIVKENITVKAGEVPPPPGPVLNSLTNLQGQHFTNTDTDGYLKGANFTGATVRAEYGTRLDPSSEELDWSYFSDAEFSYEVEDATKIRIHQPAGYEVSAYAYRYTVTTATGEVVETFE